MGTLKNLRDQGNSVIVVEHDEEAIREADYVFDIGPGAGVHGGQVVVAWARRARWPKMAASITGDYLSVAHEKSPCRATRRKGKKGKSIKVVNATGNNLTEMCRQSSRLGKFVCVTGVSGGGQVDADD